MTRVITDVTRHGIVMVADSGRTFVSARDPSWPLVVPDAHKLHYHAATNVGVSIWGQALIPASLREPEMRLDQWLESFLAKQASGDVDSLAQTLAAELTQRFGRAGVVGRRWAEHVCGFHVAGFVEGRPRVRHVHCGHPVADEPHAPCVHTDFPENLDTDLELAEKASADGLLALDSTSVFMAVDRPLRQAPGQQPPRSAYDLIDRGDVYVLRNGQAWIDDTMQWRCPGEPPPDLVSEVPSKANDLEARAYDYCHQLTKLLSVLKKTACPCYIAPPFVALALTPASCHQPFGADGR